MAIEARGNKRLGPIRPELVSRDLLSDKSVVGLVSVEGIDDVVAVAPGIGARFITLETFALGVARQIQPMPPPALSVMRGTEQAVDQLFVGRRRRITQKHLSFLWAR